MAAVAGTGGGIARGSCRAWSRALNANDNERAARSSRECARRPAGRRRAADSHGSRSRSTTRSRAPADRRDQRARQPRDRDLRPRRAPEAPLRRPGRKPQPSSSSTTARSSAGSRSPCPNGRREHSEPRIVTPAPRSGAHGELAPHVASADSRSGTPRRPAGSNCLPDWRDDLVARASPRQRAPVRAVARHRVERVRDGEDAGGERDLLAAEPVRIAARRPSARGASARPAAPSPCRIGDAAEHLLAEHRVRLHPPPLAAVSGPGFCRISSGIAILPMSCSRNPYSSPGPSSAPGRSRSSSSTAYRCTRCECAPVPRVPRLERARERVTVAEIRLLEQRALAALDLEQVAQVARVQQELSSSSGSRAAAAAAPASAPATRSTTASSSSGLNGLRTTASAPARCARRRSSASAPVRSTIGMSRVASSRLEARQSSAPLIAGHAQVEHDDVGLAPPRCAPRPRPDAASSTVTSRPRRSRAAARAGRLVVDEQDPHCAAASPFTVVLARTRGILDPADGRVTDPAERLRAQYV